MVGDMKRFAYLFTIGNKIVWSGENEVSLTHRMKSEPKEVRDEVEEFIGLAQPGYHLELPTGEFIFCTALK